jgi:hypothetical protein
MDVVAQFIGLLNVVDRFIGLKGYPRMKEESGDCFKCRHFYITWDKFFPYGCKAMGFKSKEISSAVVQQSSGTKCLYFEKKD